MTNMFLYSNWLKLSLNTRHKIATQFNIGKTKPTHVSNNEIVSDGYEIHNIESQLTIPNIQQYLQTDESDLAVLWGLLIDRIEGRTKTPVAPIIPVVGVVEPPPEPIPAYIPTAKEEKAKKATKVKKAKNRANGKS